jgi:hypothetical protein
VLGLALVALAQQRRPRRQVAGAGQLHAALFGIDLEEGRLRLRVGDEEHGDHGEHADAGGDGQAEQRPEGDCAPDPGRDRDQRGDDPGHRLAHQPLEVEALKVVGVVDRQVLGRLDFGAAEVDDHARVGLSRRGL